MMAARAYPFVPVHLQLQDNREIIASNKRLLISKGTRTVGKMHEISELLKTEAKHFGITLSPEQLAKLEAYHSVLQHWNQKTNLISSKDPLELVRFHFLESILANNFIPQAYNELLDIGTGAGFPAIPLKVVKESFTETLLEAKRKKAAFLKEVVRELGLSNVDVRARRLEDFLKDGPEKPNWEIVTVRGVNLRANTADQLVAKLRRDGLLICWHGKNSPLASLLGAHQDLVATALIDIPYSKNRYIQVFRKI